MHVTGVLWTPPALTAGPLWFSPAPDAPLGFTTSLQPSSWLPSMQDRLPDGFLGPGMALAAKSTAVPRTSGSEPPRHECCASSPTPPGHCYTSAARAAYPESNLPPRPAGIPGIPMLCFSICKPDFLAVPAHTPQTSPASDRPRGAAGKAGVKDLH